MAKHANREPYCFVGHVFNREQIDDLRRALKEAFDEVAPLLLWYADDHHRWPGDAVNMLTNQF